MEWLLLGLLVFIVLVVVGAAKRVEEDSTLWQPENEEDST